MDLDFEIKPREVLFSVIIVLLMLLFGFVIASNIENGINNANKEYSQAIHIADENMFSHCLDTDVGNVFVEGTLTCSAPLRNELVKDKEFIKLRVVHERYEMHIETYTYTDSDGKSHTEYREVWEWEYAGEDNDAVDTVEFLGKSFPLSKFSIGNRGYGTYSTGFHKRDVIYGLENGHYGTVYTTIAGNEMTDNSRFYSGMSAEEALESATNQTWMIVLFWVGWVVLTAGVVAGFVVLRNRWLD